MNSDQPDISVYPAAAAAFDAMQTALQPMIEVQKQIAAALEPYREALEELQRLIDAVQSKWNETIAPVMDAITESIDRNHETICLVMTALAFPFPVPLPDKIFLQEEAAVPPANPLSHPDAIVHRIPLKDDIKVTYGIGQKLQTNLHIFFLSFYSSALYMLPQPQAACPQ